MSHCTKFDFAYTSEDAIVKTFRKMNINCSTDAVYEYYSAFGKILGRLGYAGHKQYRAICGEIEGGHIFVCRVEQGKYELFVEHHGLTNSQEDMMIANQFRDAYIEVAVDKVLKRLDLNAIKYEVHKHQNGLIVTFGPHLEYTLSVLIENDQIVEDVKGVKGDFCTQLTEDIEDVLSQPTTELKTEWKPEVEMQIEDEVLQVLSLSF